MKSNVEQVAAVFDEWAANGRAEGMENGHGPVAKQAFEVLLEGLSPGFRYLDIGCGNGYTVRWAAKGGAEKAVGIDAAEKMVVLSQKMSENYPQAEFSAGAFSKDSFPEDSFDAIFSMEALYYFPDLSEALSAVYGALKPGAKFACIVDFYQENQASHDWPELTGVSMNLLSQVQWREHFEGAGFTVLRQERLHPPLKEGEEPNWKHQEGSLFTLGQKLR